MVLLAPLSRRAYPHKDSFHRPVPCTHLLRPCVLGMTLLAVAVVLWGYSYRLSLYRHLPDQALRIPAAKLFVERHTARMSVEKAHTPPQAVPVAATLLVPRPPLNEPDSMVSTMPAHHASTAGAPVPLRSPPFRSSRSS